MCLAVRLLLGWLCMLPADEARLMRMLAVDESTGPGLEDRRSGLGSTPGVMDGVNRFTELDLDLVTGGIKTLRVFYLRVSRQN